MDEPQRQLVCGVHAVVEGVALVLGVPLVLGVLLPRKIHKDLRNQRAKTPLSGKYEVEN